MLVEYHGEHSVELRRVGEVVEDLRGGRCGHDHIAHRERLQPNFRDRGIGTATDLEGSVRRPGIDRREILSPAHLWHIGEDVEPERVVAAQERALARSHVSGEPEGYAALAPVAPVRIRRESRLDPEPGRRAHDDERQRGDCDEHASRESP